jgi:UDP-2,4-diacetamido-2,4,6-trideoxy-beta-L-altropyranose hydrolase
MNVVFRVDASAAIGVGHLMRCLTLAGALRERDVQVRFVCRELVGNLVAMVTQRGIPVTVLPAPAFSNAATNEDYAVWLGVTQTIDAEQTIQAVNGERPDWLVVDHYALDIKWEQRLNPYVKKLMVIDDLANRQHQCDLLLDQNYSGEGECRYANKVANGCRLLLGPRYALLRPEYSEYRETQCPRDGVIRRMLLFFGGSDPPNMTGLALEALSKAEFGHLYVDVVIGANNVNRKVLEKQASTRPRTTVYGARAHLADLMASADLAIGAGGATTWERMCLGVPTVIIPIAENQRPACEALAKDKLVYCAGQSSVSLDQLAQLLRDLARRADTLVEMSMRSQLQVDGLGALRVAESMCPTDVHEIRLRDAREGDVAQYWHWVNDPTVRDSALNTSPIPWAAHQRWFANKLITKGSRLFVLEATGLPIGQVRFDDMGHESQIDYSLDVIVRGRGWATTLIALGVDLIQRDGPVSLRANVKTTNLPSVSVFLRMGFKEVVKTTGGANEVRSFLSNSTNVNRLGERELM